MISQQFLNKERLTPELFAREIQKLVETTKLDHVQAIIYYCERNKIELDSVPKYLNAALKDKLSAVYQNLNYLPKTSKLPF